MITVLSSVPFVIDSVQKLERDLPEYINLDVKEFKAIYIRYPSSDEIPYPTMMSPGSVVEFYSR